MSLEPGRELTFSRTFTIADVSDFAEVSGDRGVHHVAPDERGRVMVQGLLTATLPTKLGGDLDYLARTMQLTFLRPVFTGDTIDCRCLVAKVERQPGRTYAEFAVSCVNQHGREVLTGAITGVILDRA